jgi:hypothetical protein
LCFVFPFISPFVYVFLLFLISTSRHNTTNFLSHAAAAAIHTYLRAAAASAAAATTTPTIALKIPPKTRKT